MSAASFQDFQIIADRWLSEILQKEVFQIPNNPASHQIAELDTLLTKKNCFLFAKASTQNLAFVHFLEGRGFSLVDTNVVLEKPTSKTTEPTGKSKVRFSTSADKSAVTELARNSFQYSRFHLDPQFNTDIANKVKAEWASNFFSGQRGDAMVVAEIDGKPAGFLQLLKKENELIIDLIATAESYRNQGVASSLILFAEKNMDGVKKIKVGTQLANIPSLRLYENLGFRTTEANHVFHYHSRKE